MRAGRREDVDDVRVRLGHGGERGIDARDGKAGGHGGGAVLLRIGNADDFDEGQAAQRARVIGADVPSADQSDSDAVILFQNFLP